MNTETFNCTYGLFAKKMYTYATWLTRNRHASDDIIQQVFIKYWKSDGDFSSNEQLEDWLYAVTRNECIDFFRRYNRFASFRIRYLHQISSLDAEADGSIWQCLNILKEKERSILYLHFKIGHQFNKIAQILGIGESAVRVSAFRALEKLRKKWAKELR